MSRPFRKSVPLQKQDKVRPGQTTSRHTAPASCLETGFREWLELEQAIQRAALAAGDAQTGDACELLDASLDAQTAIMTRLAGTPGQSMHDVVYKLALWRRDCIETRESYAPLTRADKLVLSALHDLVALTGQTSVLPKRDLGFDYSQLD